ncbi:MAG: FlgD immunoglobulin-like domain containing protein [bacterium]
MFRSVKIVLVMTGLVLFIMAASSFPRTSADTIKNNSIPSMTTAYIPAYCIAAHDVGKLVLSVTNNGTLGKNFIATSPIDCFTGQPVPSCEYPKGSNKTYLYGGAYWVGGIVGRDTLVSVGVDGWQMNMEWHPDEAPFGDMIKRTPPDPGAVSQLDYIAVCTDTSVDLSQPDSWDNRPHIPLNLEITQKSYSWSYNFAEDFVLFDLHLKNIGSQPLSKVYFGIYIDGDVYKESSGSGYSDDITGFISSVQYQYGMCEFYDAAAIAWIADNDGDMNNPTNSVQNVTATSIIATPTISLSDINYNWWISNGNAFYDFGPRMKDTPGDPYRDFGTGGLGTPVGDNNKYYMLSHPERDYDQVFTASVQPTDPTWLYPNPAYSEDYTLGMDTRYLLSFGPFDIGVGETLPITFAYIGGEYFHTDPNNIDNLPNNPEQFTANLNFMDLQYNDMWAKWIYDNPGYDTDGDGYFGEFHICPMDSVLVGSSWVYTVADTFWYKGDGVPDFRAATPPPGPAVWVEPQGTDIYIRWNGLKSERSYDIFSKTIDFEGYRVYMGYQGAAVSYSMVASYDIHDYIKYYYRYGQWVPDNSGKPYTLQELRCLYGGIPNPCEDVNFNPDEYPESNPFVYFDSTFYFVPVDLNQSDLCGTNLICKRFPDAPYPSNLNPAEADPEELTEDGFFKYFEYEYMIKNLLPEETYCVSVTAFDYGNLAANIPPLESQIDYDIYCVTIPPSGEITPTDQWINVYCGDVRINGNIPEPGSVIKAYDPDGVLCGMDTLEYVDRCLWQKFGFMPIYHDDIYSDLDEGAEEGDTITFTINDVEVSNSPTVIWTSNGDSYEVCDFYTCQYIHLNEGWNLISWNRDFAITSEDMVDMLGGTECVEVILSFDQGALSYDPELIQYSTLMGLDHHFGYWFKMNCEADLEICSDKVFPWDLIPIYEGWNLVPYWLTETLPVEDALASLNYVLQVVYGYDGGANIYIPDDVASTLHDMSPGFGYWVKSGINGYLIYPGWNGPFYPEGDGVPKTITNSEIHTTNYWLSVYGSEIKIDGDPISNGSQIEFTNEAGEICGSGIYSDGILRFTPVYGRDEISKAANNELSESYTITINDQRVYPALYWTENGDRIEISELFSSSSETLPEKYNLSQNYPNPFNPSTSIDFALQKSNRIILEVFNITGQKVKILLDDYREAGNYSIQWDGTDNNDNRVASGMYLYRLTSGDYAECKKMMLVK